jgi:hypothetical protein
MKTAYELAMERLAKSAPTIRLSDDQKRRLAELDAVFAAKLAERELMMHTDIDKAQLAGDMESLEKLTLTLAHERKLLQAELEEKKDKIRQEQG